MNVEQQLKDDRAYFKFMHEIICLGVVMTSGAKPELTNEVCDAAALCMNRMMDRLARNFAAKQRGLI
jgi:hypothetical protein